ncbi:MAG: glycerate kinase [SAR202 cluster bacterium]|nr:glycerate kinase [SAR202 cluster bacterium]
MKIVIAPQGFKGSLTALEVAQAMASGITRALPAAELILVPVADGGDGTLQALVDSSRGKILKSRVTDPLGRPVEAQWGSMGDGQTAVIEMARSSGLALLKLPERDPLRTTTFGVGELFKAALDAGHRKFILGIGGSATNDGGAGFAQALGFRLLDKDGNEIPRGGAALARLSKIDRTHADPRLRDAEVTVACDVNNPLCGPTGASAIFGPQKGATPAMIKELDAALARFAEIARRDLGKDVKEIPGAGAAGGLGAGVMAFVDAQLRAGVDIVLEAVGLESRLDGADLVYTGEGQIDKSTVFNKAPVGVARLAKKRGIHVIAIAGSLGEGYEQSHPLGIDAMFPLVSGPMSLDDAIQASRRLIERAAEESMRAVLVGQQLKG